MPDLLRSEISCQKYPLVKETFFRHRAASHRDPISGCSNAAAKARRARLRCMYGPVCCRIQTSRGIGSRSMGLSPKATGTCRPFSCGQFDICGIGGIIAL